MCCLWAEGTNGNLGAKRGGINGRKHNNILRAYNSRHFPRKTHSAVGPRESESLMQSNR